jgi:hypothetical protein
MAWEKQSKSVCLLAAFLIGMGFVGSEWARALPPQLKHRGTQTPQPYVPSTALPDDVQLVNADANPTIRIPVTHSSIMGGPLARMRIGSSYGWLEISRDLVRYAVVRQTGIFKDIDEGFDAARADIINPRIENSVAQFQAHKTRHFMSYVVAWVLEGAGPPPTASSKVQASSSYTGAILEALQNFDGVVAELKLKQQAAAPPPVVVQPPAVPPPKPVSAPPPPTLVIMAPSGAGQNQTIEVNESPLTIRGVAMDDSGLPTITIKGAPAALRPKSENVAEFWSDPITLKPGDNRFEIMATSPSKADSHFQFVAHFTPKPAPVNPRALGKEEIISLLQGGVPASRVGELVRDRGIKFTPTPADLDDIRTAGGSEELIQAIQQAATPGK